MVTFDQLNVTIVLNSPTQRLPPWDSQPTILGMRANPPDEPQEALADAERYSQHAQTLERDLSRALAALRHVLPFELAVYYELRDETLVVRSMEGPLADPKIARHKLQIAKHPTIQRALHSRRPIALEAHHHANEGDPYDGVLDLPHGHSCMVVPLSAGDRQLGILTLDRTECTPYAQEAVELADVFGTLFATALVFGLQAEAVERIRGQLAEHSRLLREDHGGASKAIVRLESSPSSAIQQLAVRARQVARVDVPVLIQGETGSGKEVLAEAIHSWSPRSEHPFVKVNCAALPLQLAESELFGHLKGAFSGATDARPGRFRTAHQGTLLLDEVGDMPMELQSKLLRVIQEGVFEPVGGDKPVQVDVRILAATHIPLETAVERGAFREDLFYRLATVTLEMPPLRDRPEDAVQIAESFLSSRRQRGTWTLTRDAKDAIRRHPWKGNVRELINLLEQITIFTAPGRVNAKDLALNARSLRTDSKTSKFLSWSDMERAHLEAALLKTGGKIYGDNGAAELLDLKPTTLISKLKRAGLK